MNIKKLDKLDPRIPDWKDSIFEQRDCPFCYSDVSTEYVYRPDEMLVSKCSKCDCYYIRNAPNEDSLNKFYSNYSKNHYSKSITKFNTKSNPYSIINSYQLSKLKSKLGGSWKNKKILDFGCGRGELISHLNASGADAVGIDIDEISIESSKLNLFNLYNSLSELPNGSYFDAIILYDFVEHPIKIREILEELSNYLLRGGLIFIWTPSAFEVNYHEDDSLEIFRYTLEHMQYLSYKTCLEIANFTNCDIVHMETRGYPSSVDEYATGKKYILKKYLKFFLKSLIPNILKKIRLEAINKHDSDGNYHLFLILKK